MLVLITTLTWRCPYMSPNSHATESNLANKLHSHHRGRSLWPRRCKVSTRITSVRTTQRMPSNANFSRADISSPRSASPRLTFTSNGQPSGASGTILPSIMRKQVSPSRARGQQANPSSASLLRLPLPPQAKRTSCRPCTTCWRPTSPTT